MDAALCSCEATEILSRSITAVANAAASVDGAAAAHRVPAEPAGPSHHATHAAIAHLVDHLAQALQHVLVVGELLDELAVSIITLVLLVRELDDLLDAREDHLLLFVAQVLEHLVDGRVLRVEDLAGERAILLLGGGRRRARDFDYLC